MKKMVLMVLAMTTATAQAACPSQKFDAFFSSYADSVAVQKTYTDYPLAHTMLDYAAKPGPREMKLKLARAKLSFPLLPGAAERKRAGLALKVDEAAGNRATATLFKDDTGYKVVYVFRKDACWKLERIEDKSM